ncbi:hypothetical protein RB195_008888 [Necator americanus]|uniref:MADF domain-containing protein n=1 Tax=Necator americanus TaxID=51031 RepID=A0ABR1CQT3_NECAM
MNPEQSDSNESDGEQKAFSELSSYHSGTTMVSSEFSSGDTTDTSDVYDEEESDEPETSETDETDESEETTSSPHSSDTSFDLSTLIEETDREKLAKFVRLRPTDIRWINAAWNYFDQEPVYRNRAKPVKVVRKMRSNVKHRGNWTELQHEYNLRHPLCADGKTMKELMKLSFDARYMPLPDLTV